MINFMCQDSSFHQTLSEIFNIFFPEFNNFFEPFIECKNKKEEHHMHPLFSFLGKEYRKKGLKVILEQAKTLSSEREFPRKQLASNELINLSFHSNDEYGEDPEV